jgi:hypothetical protein
VSVLSSTASLLAMGHTGFRQTFFTGNPFLPATRFVGNLFLSATLPLPLPLRRAGAQYERTAQF